MYIIYFFTQIVLEVICNAKYHFVLNMQNAKNKHFHKSSPLYMSVQRSERGLTDTVCTVNNIHL